MLRPHKAGMQVFSRGNQHALLVESLERLPHGSIIRAVQMQAQAHLSRTPAGSERPAAIAIPVIGELGEVPAFIKALTCAIDNEYDKCSATAPTAGWSLDELEPKHITVRSSRRQYQSIAAGVRHTLFQSYKDKQQLLTVLMPRL